LANLAVTIYVICFVLPQVVVGILSLYAGLILVGKAVSGGGKKDPVVAAAPVTGAFPPSGYKSGVCGLSM
jgi:hypothetical protein